MNRAVLIRYGELFLKGKNKNYFEKVLADNIKRQLSEFEYTFYKTSGRYFITNYDLDIEEQIIDKLTKVFGIHSISPCDMVDSDVDTIENIVSNIRLRGTFKVKVNRADKSFPFNSQEYSARLGGIILKNNKDLSVDIRNPQNIVSVDIRENKKTFIFSESIKGAMGLPLGTGGKGLLLLSGGIDSPVAGYTMAKRGLTLSALHFHSYPYTSQQARDKVIELAKIMTEYTGPIKLYVCSFTKIQEAIHKNCRDDFMITIMRRIMMRIAERLCLKKGLQTIITGESLGQVASQTIESITVTNSVIKTLPVMRPLIAMDKEDIITIAEKINTFKTSILPYEDCCTVFLPDHPIIKPRVSTAEEEEQKLDIESLIEEAMSTIEVIDVR